MATPAGSETISAPRPSLRPPRRGLNANTALAVVLPSIALVLLVMYWDWVVRHYGIPSTLLARPGDVLAQLWDGTRSGVFFTHGLATMQEVAYGFLIGALGGFILGALVAESMYTRMTLYPFLIAFQMIPKVAIAPLFIIWLGYGISSKVAFTASITFFPVVINTIAGMRSVDGEVLEMMRVFRASRWQSFYRVKLKFAMPYIFASLEVAMVLSVIGAIVAEFVGATKGLGYLILQEMHKLDTARVFALLAVLSVLGIILTYIIRLLARVMLFWHESERVRE